MTRTKLTGSCSWNCGRETDNKSHICDFCWKAAELSRTNTDEGYRAWAERKRAKAANPRSEAQKAALLNAQRAKLLKHLPVGELLQ